METIRVGNLQAVIEAEYLRDLAEVSMGLEAESDPIFRANREALIQFMELSPVFQNAVSLYGANGIYLLNRASLRPKEIKIPHYKNPTPNQPLVKYIHKKSLNKYQLLI